MILNGINENIWRSNKGKVCEIIKTINFNYNNRFIIGYYLIIKLSNVV